jgi:hypothetical protein
VFQKSAEFTDKGIRTEIAFRKLIEAFLGEGLGETK